MAFGLTQKKPTDLTVVSVGAGATSCSVTFDSTPAANSLLLATAAFYQWSGTETIAFSDNKVGNSWATDKSKGSGLALGAIGSTIAATVSATFTVTATISTGNGYLDMCIQEFSGGSTSVGGHLGNTNLNSGATNPISTGAVSPTTGSELIYAAGSTDFNRTATLSWTGGSEITNDMDAVGIGAAYKESSGSENAGWSISDDSNWWGVIATYKAAGAGAATLVQSHFRFRNDDGTLAAKVY